MSTYDLVTEALNHALNPQNPPPIAPTSPRMNPANYEHAIPPHVDGDYTRNSIDSTMDPTTFPPPNNPEHDRAETEQGHGGPHAEDVREVSITGFSSSLRHGAPRGAAQPNYRNAYEASQQATALFDKDTSQTEYGVSASYDQPIRREEYDAGEPIQSKTSDIDDLFSDVNEGEDRRVLSDARDAGDPCKALNGVAEQQFSGPRGVEHRIGHPHQLFKVVLDGPDYAPDGMLPYNSDTDSQPRYLVNSKSSLMNGEPTTERGLTDIPTVVETSNIQSTSPSLPVYNVGHIFTSQLQDNGEASDDSKSQSGDMEISPIENGFGDQCWMTGARPLSPAHRESPTEFQLMAEGFEFHNELPEDVQIDKFGDKAFRKALREVKPELPRKQQWYAWDKVRQMLENSPKKSYGRPPVPMWDAVDQSQKADGRATQTLEHGGCKADQALVETNETNCPGNILLAQVRDMLEKRSNKPSREDTAEQVTVSVKDDFDPALTADSDHKVDWHPNMELPISEVWCAHGEVVSPSCYAANMGYVPTSVQPPAPSSEQPIDPISRPGCLCGCDASCQRAGQCICDVQEEGQSLHAETPPANRLSQHPHGWSISKLAEDGHNRKAIKSAATVDSATITEPTRAGENSRSGNKYIQTDSSDGTALSLQLDPITRPDTPRPVDLSVRQSIEPEILKHNLHRESTPGYEARSPSPSIISQDSLDIEMSEAPPVSPVPGHFQYPSSPDPIFSPTHTVTAHETPIPPSRATKQQSRSRSRSPVKAPAPETPGQIKPAKRGEKSRRKSTVQGGKVDKPGAKSRNVTQKLTNSARKVTEKVKKESTKVADAVAKIEATVRKQSGGTPMRKSARIRNQKG